MYNGGKEKGEDDEAEKRKHRQQSRVRKTDSPESYLTIIIRVETFFSFRYRVRSRRGEEDRPREDQLNEVTFGSPILQPRVPWPGFLEETHEWKEEEASRAQYFIFICQSG